MFYRAVKGERVPEAIGRIVYFPCKNELAYNGRAYRAVRAMIFGGLQEAYSKFFSMPAIVVEAFFTIVPESVVKACYELLDCIIVAD